MPKTPAKAAADNRWNAANIRKVSTNLRREYAEAFAAKCKANGTTPSAVLRKAVDAYMGDDARHEEES